MAKDRFQVDEIASNGEKTIAENIVAYRVAPILGAMDDEDLICKANLYGVLTNPGSDKFYAATTAFPITMVNGVDFVTTALRPIVNMVRSLDATTDTNDGFAPLIVKYNFTDATKTVLLSITIPDNGFGSLEFDSWFRVV